MIGCNHSDIVVDHCRAIIEQYEHILQLIQINI